MSSAYENQLDAFELYHKLQEDIARSSSGSSSGIGLPALGHALAGSTGTAISHLLLYPLDLAITRLQVQTQLRGPDETASAAADAGLEYVDLPDAVRKIYRSEGGLRAFYVGCVTDTSKSILDAFVFFLAYNFLRQRRRASTGSKHLSIPSELGIGMLAGAVSKAITTPVQQIVTRKQTAALISARRPDVEITVEHSPNSDTASIAQIARSIYAQKGLAGFWAGYSASLILTLNPALTFLFQGMLSRALAPSPSSSTTGGKSAQRSSGALVFLVAALSKAAASSVTYPFSVAKTRAQVSSRQEGASRNEKHVAAPAARSSTSALRRRLPGVLTGLHAVYKSQGLVALYAGLSGELVKGFLGHGLTMALKDRIHVVIVSVYFLLLKTMKRWPDDAVQGGADSVRAEAAREVARVRALVEWAANEVQSAASDVADVVVKSLQDDK